MNKEQSAKILKIAVLVFALLLAVAIAFANAAFRWEIQLNQMLNVRTSGVVGASDDDVLFKSDYDNIEDLFAAKSELIKDIGSEGCVLLKNENNALPLAKNSKVSLFGKNSTDLTYGTSNGSGQIQAECDDMKTVFTSAGMQVNETLWDFYTGLNKIRYYRSGAMQLGEATQADYENAGTALSNSYEEYNDAVFITITRAFGEGNDAPTDPSVIKDGDGTHNALQLHDVERNMISIAKNAAGADGKVIVLLNSDNVMEIGELKDDPDIDAILWIGGQGVWGLYGVADVIMGVTSPSGKLVDTYAYSNMSSPAAQNYGDFTWTNADTITSSVGEAEGASKYVIYQEGVYVGYKYYETRYEDSVLGQGNATSTTGVYNSTSGWNYEEEICYTFGYGLSYTTFTQTMTKLLLPQTLSGVCGFCIKENLMFFTHK